MKDKNKVMMEARIIQIPFSINEEMVDTIMCSAIEGGINYWCEGAYSDDYKGAIFLSDVISMGGEVWILTDHEQEGVEHEQYINELRVDSGLFKYKIDLDILVEGFKRYVAWAMEKTNRHFYTNPCDIDADEADTIIQLAIFNELVFG